MNLLNKQRQVFTYFISNLFHSCYIVLQGYFKALISVWLNTQRL